MVRPLSILVLVALWTGGVALAETHVLSVGVERYEDELISSLRYAAADATAVAAAFRAAGVPPKNVLLFTSDQTDPARRPTRINLLTALDAVRGKAGPDDRLIVFFAGHGVELEGQQYLLTVDARQSLVADTSLPLRLVNRALEGLRAAEVLFLIDACRNDPQAGRGDADATLTDGLARGLRPVLSATGAGPRLVATLLACDVGQRAWEDPDAGHGVFTVALLRGLSGQAADGEGRVTLTGLAGYVQREVGAWSQRTGRPQTPKLLNPQGGQMVVLVPPPEPLVSVAFTNQPLAAAVAELAQQCGAQIVLGQGVNGAQTVSGRLENQPLATALRLLLTALGLTVRRDGAVYVLEAPAAAPAQPAAGPPAPRPPGSLVVAQDGSGQYTTVGAALQKARLGATILIRPGTYDEHLAITRPVSLVADGPREQVILTSQNGWTVMVTEVRADQTVTLQGLTIRSQSTLTDASTGAVAARSAGLVQIDDCAISAQGPRDRVFGLSCGRVQVRQTAFTESVGTAVSANGQAPSLFEDCLFDAVDADLAVVLCSLPQARFVRCRWTGEVENNDAKALRQELGNTILEDCEFALWAGAQVLVMAGGTMQAKGCRVTSSKQDAFLITGGALTFEDGTVKGAPGHAFWLVPNGGHLDLARSKVTDAAVALTVEDGASARVTECDFAGCGQPYYVEPQGKLER